MRVNKTELARKLGVSRQRVYTMISEGIITPDSKGLIDFDDALTAIAANTSPIHGGKRTPAPVEGTFNEHRTRKEAALANLRELEAAEKKGELVSAEEVRAELAKAFTAVKTRLRSIPAKAAGEVYHSALDAGNERAGRAAIFKILQTAIDDALLELSGTEKLTGQ